MTVPDHDKNEPPRYKKNGLEVFVPGLRLVLGVIPRCTTLSRSRVSHANVVDDRRAVSSALPKF